MAAESDVKNAMTRFHRISSVSDEINEDSYTINASLYWDIGDSVEVILRGNYTWTQGAIFIGTGEESGDGRRLIITYYETV